MSTMGDGELEDFEGGMGDEAEGLPAGDPASDPDHGGRAGAQGRAHTSATAITVSSAARAASARSGRARSASSA